MTIVKKIPAWFNHTNIYLFGLGLMLVSLPTSKYLMSIAQFILIFNWLIDPKSYINFVIFFQKQTCTGRLFHFCYPCNRAVVDFRFALCMERLTHKASAVGPTNYHLHFPPTPEREDLLLSNACFHWSQPFRVVLQLLQTLYTRDLSAQERPPFHFSNTVCIKHKRSIFFAGIYLSFQKKHFSKVFRIFLALSSIWLLFFSYFNGVSYRLCYYSNYLYYIAYHLCN